MKTAATTDADFTRALHACDDLPGAHLVVPVIWSSQVIETGLHAPGRLGYLGRLGRLGRPGRPVVEGGTE